MNFTDKNLELLMNPKIIFIFNVLIPILVTPIYFVLAAYIRKIKPLRLLIMGEKTYQYAFWIFLLFGLFFLGRPFQILLGGHPSPLIISSIREFIMIGLITPCVLAGLLNQLFYDSEFPGYISGIIFGICILLGVAFVYCNIKSVGGSHQIFEYNFLGVNITANDGNWFLTDGNKKYLIFLFIIRLISPVILMFLVGILAIWKAIIFPKNSLYANLPTKYFLEGLAVLIFVLSILFTGIMAYFWKYQTQWYYFGALIAGIIGYIALKIPPRNFVIKNELHNPQK